jgi:hypothetical protein
LTCCKKCTYTIKFEPKEKMKAMNTPHLFTISTHCCHDACQGILHIYRVFVTLYPLATTMDISFDFMITKPYTNRLVTKKNQFHTWRKDNHLQTWMVIIWRNPKQEYISPLEIINVIPREWFKNDIATKNIVNI